MINRAFHGPLLFALTLAGLAASADPAAAQIEDLIPEQRDYVSSENFALELRLGPYVPDFGDRAINDAFEQFYPDDNGLMWEVEVDVLAFTLPDILDFGIGALAGRANYEANTLIASDLDAGDVQASDEASRFRLYPLAGLLTLRIDALPRRLRVPLILTGKLGYQFTYYSAEAGTPDERTGWSRGLRWAGQLALDLDVFEPSQARMMDEEWGINHSFLFFEYYGFVPADGQLEVGATTWCAGLGFMF